MNYFELGETGMMVSEVGFGGGPIIRLKTNDAISVLQRALERGINFYDTANAYHDSQSKIGKAFQGVREKIFISTKTFFRDEKGAAEEIDNSLLALKTDYIDIFQLHQISQERDFETAIGPGGAMEALFKAQQAGKIRHIGVSSHNLEMGVRLVRSGLFSTIEFPLNFIETKALEELRPTARDYRIGMISMKPFAGGMIDNGNLAFKFLRQYPDILPLPGFDSVQYVDDAVGIYSKVNQITDEDSELMEEYRRKLGKEFCRRCEYCQPCPNGVHITMAMCYPIVVSRMTFKVTMNFAKESMESVSRCIGCEECTERCPYELPIPEMLKRSYEMYERQRKEHGC